jgi:hypothetical protein
MITIPPAQAVRSRAAAAVGAVALLCALLTACGGAGTTSTSAQGDQPGSPATAASSSACGLVTVSEVTAATGKPMTAGHGAGDICTFSATDDPSLIVYLQVYGNAISTGVARKIESGGQHVSGLGDVAFWSVAGTLFAQKGSKGLTITLPSLTLSSRTAPPKIVTLAAAALARL